MIIPDESVRTTVVSPTAVAVSFTVVTPFVSKAAAD
jgi:hypothetical protein